MPDIRIDLDEPEPVAPARPRRWRGLLVVAVVAALALGAVLIRVLAPDEPVGSVDLRPEWSLDLPEEFGEAVAARVQGGTVLVVAQLGLVAADRETGAEKWRRDLGVVPGGLSAETAWDHVRLAGNSLVVTRFADGGPAGFDVLDLPSGDVRFSVPGPALIHLTLNTLLVLDEQLTSYALSDGRELWRRSPGAEVFLPEAVSFAGVVGAGPGFVEPSEGVLLEVRADGVDVVDVNTGDVAVTWPADVADRPQLHAVAGVVVRVDEAGIHGLSPETGEEVWERYLSGGSPGSRWAFAGGLFIDVDGYSPALYNLIDLATGEGPERLDLGGRRPVFFAPDLIVGIDPEQAELQAFGRASWTTSLRPEGWTAAGFRPEGLLAGDGWLALGGELGFGGDTQRHLWAVELETGRVGSVPDGLLVGFEDGALVSVAAGDRRTVRLHEVAA